MGKQSATVKSRSGTKRFEAGAYLDTATTRRVISTHQKNDIVIGAWPAVCFSTSPINQLKF